MYFFYITYVTCLPGTDVPQVFQKTAIVGGFTVAAGVFTMWPKKLLWPHTECCFSLYVQHSRFNYTRMYILDLKGICALYIHTYMQDFYNQLPSPWSRLKWPTRWYTIPSSIGEIVRWSVWIGSDWDFAQFKLPLSPLSPPFKSLRLKISPP